MTSSYGQSHPRILILADDLTGACDAAVAFGQRGARTQVLIDRQWTSSAPVEVRAICTESRDIPVYQSIERLNWVVRESRVQPHHHVFKKIDSVFRGNTFHEIRAAIDAFQERLVVIAPSFPALGRRAVGGAMLVSDITSERSLSLREPLAAAGVYPAWLSPKQSIPADNTRRILFCDAETDEDLDAIVTTAQQLQKNILWIGSGGLAHALAAELLALTHEPEPALIDPAKGTVLVFAGSDHPVTVHQISTLREQHETATASENTTSNDQVVIHTITCGITTESDIRAAAAPFIGRQLGCLFMTGGDTAMHVCRALGVRVLDLHREFEPGVPHATAIGGPFAGCTVILKSGGFGEAETISRIASHHKAVEFASAHGVRS